MLQRFARLAVPEVGDWCSIWSLADDGMVGAVAAAHANPAGEAALRALVCRQEQSPDTPYGVAKVIRSGVAQHAADVPATWRADLQGAPAHQDFSRPLPAPALQPWLASAVVIQRDEAA